MKVFQKLALAGILFFTISSFASCKKDKIVTEVPLQIKYNPVSKKEGQQTLAIKTQGEWTLKKTGANVDWLTLSKESGVGDSNDVILSYQENPGDKERKAGIVLYVLGKYVSDVVFVQKGEGGGGSEAEDEPQGGGGDTPSPTPDPSATSAWLELPQQYKDDGRELHIIKMEYEGKQVRNYSFYYENEKKAAAWVAYPLIEGHLSGPADRKNSKWRYYDESIIAAKYQTKVFPSGWGSDYDRGHQLPAADRKCSQGAMDDTFYVTNQTAQIGKLNRGPWENLESKVRSWARKCDTLYVVSGCVFNPNHAEAQYIKDRKGVEVEIPVGYYKVLLAYVKNSTQTISNYIGYAIYKEHTPDGGSEEPISIAEMEKRLKIDFFVNLPTIVGADVAKRIEERDPKKTTFWN